MSSARCRFAREENHIFLEPPDVEDDKHIVAAKVEQVLGPCGGLALDQLHARPEFTQVEVEMDRKAGREAAAQKEDAPAWIGKPASPPPRTPLAEGRRLMLRYFR